MSGNITFNNTGLGQISCRRFESTAKYKKAGSSNCSKQADKTERKKEILISYCEAVIVNFADIILSYSAIYC